MRKEGGAGVHLLGRLLPLYTSQASFPSPQQSQGSLPSLFPKSEGGAGGRSRKSSRLTVSGVSRSRRSVSEQVSTWAKKLVDNWPFTGPNNEHIGPPSPL